MTSPRDENRTTLNAVALGIGALAVIAIVFNPSIMGIGFALSTR